MENTIEIKIKQVGLSNNYYTNGILDLADDSTINTIIQLVDVREPEKRATDFVQTFTLPATKRNNQAFQHIKMKGFQSWGYDPSKKMECQILVNGNQYFNGYLQLNKINEQDGYTTSYEVTVYAKLGDFFSSISDKTIRELADFSDFDHISDWWSIVRSWGPIGSDPKVGAYPKPSIPPEPLKSVFYSPGITYKGAPRDFQLGFGYVYPPIFIGQTEKAAWATQDFKPAFYVKTIFDRILQSKGVAYQSNFLSSEYFRRLIMPSQSEIEGNTGNAQLTQAQIDACTVWAKYNPNSGVGLNSNSGAPSGVGPFYSVASVGTETGKSYGPYKLKFSNDSVAPAKDIGGQYDPSTGVLTVKKNGRYTLSCQIRATIAVRTKYYGKTGSAGSQDIQGGDTIPVTLSIRNQSGAVVASNKTSWDIGAGRDSAGTGVIFSTKELACSLKNQIISAGQQYYVTLDFATTGSNYKYKTYDKTVPFWYIANAGDYNGTMDIYIKGTELNGTDNPTEGSKIMLTLADTSISDGDKILMNDYVPNLKAIDLIRDINKMFNLYWKWDDRGFFIIEPRDKFYESSNQYVIKDWTFKADNNETQTIEPLYDLSTKSFLYKYDTDDTYENQDHDSETKEVYGTKRVEVENDFVTGETSTELSFAASPMIDFLGTGLKMPSFTEYKDDKRLYKKPGARILFYGGFQKQYAWTIKNYAGKTMALTHFPYCGHLDNPDAPRWDLNWGISKKYYYGWQNLTQNTLFNQFWGNTIDELTDRNGHLLTIDLILSELDIRNLDIRDIIQIDQVHYRINKVTHNPLNNKATAELIKLKGLKVYDAPAGLITSVAPNYLPDPVVPGLVPTPVPPAPVPVPNPPKPFPAPVVPGGWPNPWPEPWTPSPWEIGITTIWDQEERPWKSGSNPAVSGRPWSWNSTTSTGTTITSTSKPPAPWRSTWNDTTPVSIWTGTVTNDWASDNSYSPMNSQKVVGRSNTIAPSARIVSIQGDSNIISDNASNIQVVGNNNIIAPGVQNVMVVGDNQFVSESNITNIRGSVQRSVGNRGAKILRSPSNSVGVGAKAIKGGKDTSKGCSVVVAGQDTNSFEIPHIDWDDSIVMTPFGPKTA